MRIFGMVCWGTRNTLLCACYTITPGIPDLEVTCMCITEYHLPWSCEHVHYLYSLAPHLSQVQFAQFLSVISRFILTSLRVCQPHSRLDPHCQVNPRLQAQQPRERPPQEQYPQERWSRSSRFESHHRILLIPRPRPRCRTFSSCARRRRRRRRCKSRDRRDSGTTGGKCQGTRSRTMCSAQSWRAARRRRGKSSSPGKTTRPSTSTRSDGWCWRSRRCRAGCWPRPTR